MDDKLHLKQALEEALQRLQQAGTLPQDAAPPIDISASRDSAHGDFSSNIAMRLAKVAGMPARALAEQIAAAVVCVPPLDKIEVAPAGFINFFMSEAVGDLIAKVLDQGQKYGHSDSGQQRSIQLEFVSANPTGPLHIGHGRSAAYGASLANLLRAVGYRVSCEYYVNDAGRQMHILAASVWLRYLQQSGVDCPLADGGYRGDYIQEMARQLIDANGDQLVRPAAEIFADLPLDTQSGGDGDRYLDALIVRAKQLLGPDYQRVFDHALTCMLDDIQADLHAFGVSMDVYFSERSLIDSGAVARACDKLQASGHLYTQEGALWFRASALGDEKDRVVRRQNGETTYFASDIAYALSKFERGFEHAIYIWGADHHGYIARLKAAVVALGEDAARIEIPLVQFVSLYRAGQKMQMSTRSGNFITLRALREEIGGDAARFFYVNKRIGQHLDMDLDLACAQSSDNPMYNIQYAHARVYALGEKLAEMGYVCDRARGLRSQHLLTCERSRQIARLLGAFPDSVQTAALRREPHRVVYGLQELACAFHAWYSNNTFIVPEDAWRDACIVRALAVAQVIKNGLMLIGVSAPDSMHRTEENTS